MQDSVDATQDAKESIERYLVGLNDRLTGWFSVVEGSFPPGQPRFVLMLNTGKGNQMVCRMESWSELYEKVQEYGRLIKMLQDADAV